MGNILTWVEAAQNLTGYRTMCTNICLRQLRPAIDNRVARVHTPAPVIAPAPSTPPPPPQITVPFASGNRGSTTSELESSSVPFQIQAIAPWAGARAICWNTIIPTQTKGTVYYRDLDGPTITSEVLASFSSNQSVFNTNTRDAIIQQFAIDFPRMVVCTSMSQIHTTIDHFKRSIQRYIDVPHSTLYRGYYLLLMLCTQATFYYNLSILTELYSNHMLGIHVVAGCDAPIIHLIDHYTHIDLLFIKNFCLLDTQAQKEVVGLTYRASKRLHTVLHLTIKKKGSFGIHSARVYWKEY